MNRVIRLAGRAGRLGRRHAPAPVVLQTSPDLPEFASRPRPVVAVCHPDWRGIRSATYAQGLPVVESSDVGRSSPEILSMLNAAGTRMVIINGFPPGTDQFAKEATARGLLVRVVLHSSMAQHGSEPPEAVVASRLCEMVQDGIIDALGFAKEGQAEAFSAMGCPAVFVPSRTVRLDAVASRPLGSGRHFGVFAEASWRKNVVTQLGAVAILGGTAHVTFRPDVGYLSGGPQLVEHGLVSRQAFFETLASTDQNLAVSLYECFPVLAQESYWLGTPCLMSRTSALFRNDPQLWEIATVAEHDNPRAIAGAAERLLEACATDGLVSHAQAWMEQWNEATLDQWASFADPDTSV